MLTEISQIASRERLSAKSGLCSGWKKNASGEGNKRQTDRQTDSITSPANSEIQREGKPQQLDLLHS
jgi:hypothetical protein